MRKRNYFVNRVIRLLVSSHFLFFFSLGLTSPIFSVFIIQNIETSTLEVIGIATAAYWIARVATTVPFSKFMDRTKGERDEYYFLLAGSFIMATLPLLYLFARFPWHVYVIEFFMGLAGSMAVPAWRILFTDHLDHGETGFEWSLEDIGSGLAIAGSAYIGSLVADRFGFDAVFVLLAALGYIGTVIILPLYQYARPTLRVASGHRARVISLLRQHERQHIRVKVHGV